MSRIVLGLFSRHCPYCRSIEFRSVDPRNFLERIFLWILLPHRCALCGHHVYFFRWQAPVAYAA